jgi:glucose/arabinose dehydrogenase
MLKRSFSSFALSLVVPAALAEAASLNLRTVLERLDRPVALAHAGDGSGRLFIVQQGGQILIYDGSGLRQAPFLDVSSLVSCCSERGLLGLSFHPQYETNGLFYVNYTDVRGDTQIVRYRVSSDPDVADPGSGELLLAVDQPFANHNGGELAFGPDGKLWIGMGDGGSAGDPQNRAQDGGTLLGKMLRLDVDAAFPYAVPADNPFLSDLAVRGEIWALGLRNPWRFSFDRLTGDLFIADVGQNAIEEVNFEPAGSPGGRNYGWRRMEGSQCFNPPSDCHDGSLILPILEYSHAEGCSVTGGYRYRGAEMPEHAGTYFFGDFCSGNIWGATVDEATGVWSRTLLLDTPISLTTFGEDENGELYAASLEGALFRLHGEVFCEGESTEDEVIFEIVNRSDRTVVAEAVLIHKAPGGSRTRLARTVDGALPLPARFSMDVLSLSSSAPKGTYLLECTFTEPSTGGRIAKSTRSVVLR